MSDPATTANLAARLSALSAQHAHLRLFDAAEMLDAPEAALLGVSPDMRCTRLKPDWAGLLAGVGNLGRVMALTRNRSVVHERHGVYRNVSVTGAMGLVLGDEIDLRLFLSQWAFAFAVEPVDADKRRPSLQFFDAAGHAVHKIHATGETEMPAWRKLVGEFALGADALAPVYVPRAAAPVPRPDAEIDVAGLREAWQSLRDTHDFFAMLKKFKVGRFQAMRLAGAERAQSLAPHAVRGVLERAADGAVPIMVFVGNPGCIQIHGGPVRRLAPRGPWFNVLDPDFNLHLREDHVAHVYRVRKPTDDGIVTSIEAYDASGETIAMIFGKRKPGEAERADWHEIAQTLAAEAVAA